MVDDLSVGCVDICIFLRVAYFGDVHMDQTMKLNAWVLRWWVGFSGVFRSLFLAVSIDGSLIAVVVCQVHWMFELLVVHTFGCSFFQNRGAKW